MSGLRLIAGAFALACLALSSGAVAGTAKSGSSPAAAVRHGRIAGIVPSRHAGAATPFAGLGNGNLTYHGGPVMRTNTTYAIYWIPGGYSVSANYQSTINGFFQNVADASGATTNVYSLSAEYSDTTGSLAYASTFGGAYVDTDALPASGCTDPGLPVCLSDSQITAEIDKVVAAQGWTAGVTHQFFMFTPKTVGSCFDAGPTVCAYDYYCAYHSYFASSLGNGTVVYANQPYTANSATPGGCDTGQRPNSDDADPTINVMSHEHNEAITDPLLNAWYDAEGYEDGDKCAWIFGSALGQTGGGGTAYNEEIGTGKYYLQQEWSNSTVDASSHTPGTCLQRNPPPTPTISTFTPTSGVAGKSVKITGTNFTGASDVQFNAVDATSFTVDSATQITAVVPPGATSGQIGVTTSTGNVVSAGTFTTLVVTSFDPQFGGPGTTVSITGSGFSGASAVRFNGKSATFIVASATRLSAKVPANASSGKISVTTTFGTAASSGSFGFIGARRCTLKRCTGSPVG